ncbi:MAG: DNA polymerase/3'-5' exonuclease PolX [Phycisphaerales bacterium]|jgi:DNA polymerase (family 10)|nr:DNA polymerase/3'-5' exonuclease PolX [Phycisphaerales bacterium]
MSDQRVLATEFEMLAALMEVAGQNAFKVAAVRRVARVLEDFEGDLRAVAAEPGALESMDGVGKSSASKIRQWCDDGTIAELDTLRGEIPAGLVPLLDVSGLGPKTVGRLWREADVTDHASLRAAIDDGRLAALPRMGAKTIANILDSLNFAAQSADRTSIGRALPMAESLAEDLRSVDGVHRVEWAGSLRRGCETIGDIDLLATTSEPARLMERLTRRPDVTKVLASGDTKASVRLEAGIQVDLRVVDREAFGAALLYFTGSKEHNVALRHAANTRGMRLNEYGLFKDDGDETPPQDRGMSPLASVTEADIYQALDLPWHPPELRESHDSLDAAPPDLIDQGDIRCDLHTHTTASDGHLSIADMAREAIARGYHTLAITDHSKSSVQAGGLDEQRLRSHIDDIRAVDASLSEIRLLAGAEVDIHADGRLDYDDDLLAELDIVLAAPHVSLRQSPKDATKRLVAAVSHPLIHILVHPTGRIIGRRPGLEPDMDALVAAAAEHGTALEINANPQRLDLRDRHVRKALAAGARITINTDAHAAAHFDFMRYGVVTGRRGGLTAKSCINAYSASELMDWLDR